VQHKVPLEAALHWAEQQGCNVLGCSEGYIDKAQPLKKASRGGVSFCVASSDAAGLVEACNASIIICPPLDYPECVLREKMLIVSDQPRLTFMRFLQSFFQPAIDVQIHPTAVIHEEAKIGENTSIGAGSIVGMSTIGTNSHIGENVIIRDQVTIGNNVNIFPGTVIGSDGFGYERNAEGVVEKFPHVGGVIIEDNVEIGANSCIDRGTLDDTIIRRGAKIDNLVHVAHNVEIGEETLVIALSMLGGGAKIGKRSWIAPSAVVSNKIEIGDDALVGLGAVVVKNVSSEQIVMGAPARDQHDFRKFIQFINSNIRDA
tara:strand:- start:2924 stop:3871 length:948 start_codon:yes stop_codon:yes gene_type:complete